jgi:thymidylate synthase
MDFGELNIVDEYNPDVQYRRIVNRIINHGATKGDRTGVGTKAIWGEMARFDLSNGSFPIISLKRVYWKMAVKEMIWFLKGDMNIRSLLQMGVDIWTDWPLKKYREFTCTNIPQKEFEQMILEDEEFAQRWGDLGPCYGSIWRRFKGHDGIEYDQIQDVIDQIMNNPNSRRIIFHGWNVPDIPKMTLPPCHLLYQYGVTPDGHLNSMMYQRKH